MSAKKTPTTKKPSKFQKGKSGNPKGRPPGKKNATTLVKLAVQAECEQLLIADMPRIINLMVKEAIGYEDHEPDKEMQKFLVNKFLPNAGQEDSKGKGKIAAIHISINQSDPQISHSGAKPAITVTPEGEREDEEDAD